jgi:hypothetical protein
MERQTAGARSTHSDAADHLIEVLGLLPERRVPPPPHLVLQVLGNIGSLGRQRVIRAPVHATMQILQPSVQVRLVLLPCETIDAWSRSSLKRVEAVPKRDGHMVQ